MNTTTRKVRCRCKNADRHFGVCKCHRHKGDTVSELTLPALIHEALAAPTAEGTVAVMQEGIPKIARQDIWWCAHCDREWTVASLPHNPACPRCGKGGWWRRFA